MLNHFSHSGRDSPHKARIRSGTPPLPNNAAFVKPTSAEQRPDIVFRALRPSEVDDVADGLGIGRPQGLTTPTQHVLGANKATIHRSRLLRLLRLLRQLQDAEWQTRPRPWRRM